MTDDGITQVLEEIRAVAEDLIEIKADVKLALTHGDDIKALRDDIIRIDKKLIKIDAFVYGDPPLEARLKRLEVKQEKDRKTAAKDTKDAGDKQEGVNLGFTDRIAELFSITNKTSSGLLALMGTIILVGSAVGTIILRAAFG